MTEENTFQDPMQFDAERAKLQRRRKIAEEILGRQQPATGQMVGNMYVPNMSGIVEHTVNRIDAHRTNRELDAQEKLLSANEADNHRRFMQQQPEAVQRLAPGLQIPSLRSTISQQIGHEYDAPRREAEQTAKRTYDAEQAELNRIEKGEQLAADRVAREDMRRIPTSHITISNGATNGSTSTPSHGKPPSGYRYTADGNLTPIPGGPASAKPLTAKQLETQRGFMDLESSIANYEKLLDGYDFQGKTAADPAKRAQMEGAYTDLQMKMKTLYELGAPQAGDLKLLSQAIPSPVDLSGSLRGAAFGSAPFKAKLSETRKLLANSRANFETQFSRATPPAAAPQVEKPTIVREVKLKDGRIGVEYSDGTRGFK